MASTQSKRRRLISAVLLMSMILMGFFLMSATNPALREAQFAAICIWNLDLIFGFTRNWRLRTSAIVIVPIVCLLAWTQHRLEYGFICGLLATVAFAAVSFAAVADGRRQDSVAADAR